MPRADEGERLRVDLNATQAASLAREMFTLACCRIDHISPETRSIEQNNRSRHVRATAELGRSRFRTCDSTTNQ